MAKSKVKGKGGSFSVKAGGGSMFGKQAAGPQKAGMTGKAGTSGGKWAKGGSGKMFGFTGSKAASPK